MSNITINDLDIDLDINVTLNHGRQLVLRDGARTWWA